MQMWPQPAGTRGGVRLSRHRRPAGLWLLVTTLRVRPERIFDVAGLVEATLLPPRRRKGRIESKAVTQESYGWTIEKRRSRINAETRATLAGWR